MSNQWGRQPIGMDSRKLVLGIIIVGIIVYLFLPNLFKGTNPSTEPTVPATSTDNINPPSSFDSNTLNSSGYPIQNFSNNNILNSRNGDEITTGYWIVFLYNSTIQQLPVNTQDYAFIQELVNSDTKGNQTDSIYLVENGQIHQYIVSNDTYSIISSLENIKKRSSNSSSTSTTPTPIVPTPSSPTPTIPNNSNSNTASPNITNPSTITPGTATPNTTTPDSNP